MNDEKTMTNTGGPRAKSVIWHLAFSIWHSFVIRHSSFDIYWYEVIVAKERILIVDDDAIIVDSLREFLRLEGYDAEGAEDFDTALTLLEKRPYQIVISDVNMPDGDGFELLRTIRDLLAEPPADQLARMAGKAAEFHYLPSKHPEAVARGEEERVG